MRSFLEKHILVTDGAMGTYYVEKTGRTVSSVEESSRTEPDVILAIHQEYLDAGGRFLVPLLELKVVKS